MVNVTQTRGSEDTWAPLESGARPLVITLLFAFFVHFGPPIFISAQNVMSWLGLALSAEEDEGEVPEQEVIVPIDLDMFYDEQKAQDGVDDVEPDVVPPEPEAPAEQVVVVPTPNPEKVAAPPPKPEPLPEEPKNEEPEKPQAKKKQRLEGAFDAAGDNNLARAEHPNVNIYIAGKELRKRDLSSMFGELLNAVPEWQLLLGGTNIDPIADFDHVLISAPHMKKKGRWIVARVGYNVPDKKMKDAIGIAAQRSKGKWLDEYKLPVASVDDNKRKVVLIEQRDQLVVLPEGAEKQIDKLEGVGRFPDKPTAGIVIDMVTPANAFKSKFPFPKSIEKLRLRFTLEGETGYRVEIEMIDEDPVLAKKNAAFLEEKLGELRPIPLVSLFKKKYFFGKPTFETEDEVIRISAPVTRAQVARIMKLVKVWLENREAATKSKKKKKKRTKAKAAKKTGRAKARPAKSGPKPKPKPKKKSGSGLFDHLR